jgi:hypothetical protein
MLLDDAEACDTENASNVYYVSDGVYGSFSRILVDQTTVEPVVLDVRFAYFCPAANGILRMHASIAFHDSCNWVLIETSLWTSKVQNRT